MNDFHKKNRLLFLIACLIAPLYLTTQPFAQDGNIEYKIKAGYLYNFTKFITWPDDKSATFNICIVGKDPFGSIINPIENRTVKDKPIRLHRFRTVYGIEKCHIIYFSESSAKLRKPNITLPSVLTISSTTPILSVGESKQFSKAGGMISFFHSKGKIKLTINLSTLKKSKLEVSAKLLEVAEMYEGESDD